MASLNNRFGFLTIYHCYYIIFNWHFIHINHIDLSIEVSTLRITLGVYIKVNEDHFQLTWKKKLTSILSQILGGIIIPYHLLLKLVSQSLELSSAINYIWCRIRVGSTCRGPQRGTNGCSPCGWSRCGCLGAHLFWVEKEAWYPIKKRILMLLICCYCYFGRCFSRL